MRRLLLDTGAASDCIFRRRGIPERVNAARLNGAKVGIAMPVMAELLGGAEFSASRDKKPGNCQSPPQAVSRLAIHCGSGSNLWADFCRIATIRTNRCHDGSPYRLDRIDAGQLHRYFQRSRPA